ncbi:hypothetical protein [Actinomycetospora cinnamomea]|uniref:DUF3040 family protein n=1 Tax=Actinomycetospora cinnamomea TaxID=663609 RepID=A0A2U1F3Z2_9PSEU|nr:hypothetical protein [Actinomycetospora cinnamomea]PVZ06894.1 hypothetical protein C8D89_11287 [Actinomycetospora cinnamomea]
MATEPFRPEPAPPLDERERAVFARLAADLARDGSAPPRDAPAGARPRRDPGPRTRVVVIQVVVVSVLAIVLMPSVWVGAVLALIVLAGPLAATWWGARRGRR